MCDTILATSDATAEGIVLFGKNSDRQRNEAQAVEYLPRGVHASHAQVRCTHIVIPQAQQTHAALLCRPFWIWGAEMGANEYGVVIGNEALHARNGAPEEPALTGMDLLRLALERATSAAAALDIITSLLERYGQGGNCGHITPQYYNNGFMIADPHESFVLETIGREWLSARVRGVHSISNGYSIGQEACTLSKNLHRLIEEQGWSNTPTQNYARVLANHEKEHIGSASVRQLRSTSLLKACDGQLIVSDMARILRDHGGVEQRGAAWHPQQLDRALCMHAGPAERPAQTTCAMISELRPRNAVHWVTGTAAPCISIFKPVLLDVPLPSQGAAPTERFDVNTLWWRHERMHRTALLGNFSAFLDEIKPERDAIEADFHERVTAVLNASIEERFGTIAACWTDAMALENSWFARLTGTSISPMTESAYYAAWAQMNQVAGMQ